MVYNGMSGEGTNIFSGSLLQSSSDQRFRRSWTTLSSFGLQVLAMGLLLMLPLVRPGRIPLLHRLATPISLGQPMPEAAPAHAQASPSAITSSNMLNNRLMQPTRIPSTIAQISDDAPPQPFGLVGSGDSPAGVQGLPSGIAGGGGEVKPVLSTPPPAPAHPVRISHMSVGSLIYQTQPVYPPIARTAHVEGPVVLAALISREGTIENLHVITGHPMLVRAAVDAVSQWRYRPYVLNNEAVEVETQITVNFYLAH